MKRYPHTKLFYDVRRTVVLSGPHIQVLDIHGRLLYSTTTSTWEDEAAVIKSGMIHCSGMSEDGRYLATAGDDKRLKIWDLESLTLLSARLLPKKPTSVQFSRNMDILVSDKFGDVFRYTLHPNDNLSQGKTTSDALASHENPSGGELVLGHTSLLTSFLLTADERFIITADRDEHIRVSWYPEGYSIESFCLGHKKYVSTIHIPVASPASLISGGGDPELKIWDWMTGQLQRDILISTVVEPFIKVKAPKGRRNAALEHGDLEVHESAEDSNNLPNSTATVLVVHRISSFLSGAEPHVVFSMVGATAIFEFSLTKVDEQPGLRHYDFGKPVIDFTVCEGGLIWVLLDADFPDELDAVNELSRKLIQVIQWSNDEFVDAGSSALLNSLNNICSLPATAEDLEALDLYHDLSSLPKSIDGEQALSQSIHEPPEDEPSEDTSSGLTKRALGRLKHKRALGQLTQEKAQDFCDMPGPDAKKMKADSDNEEA